MNRLAILSLGASALLGGAAAAADLPVKAVPRAPAFAPPSWAGFYIGAHAGYGWKNNDFQEVIAVAPLRTVGGIGSEGWVAGGHFGHNWQYGAWVVGAELDLSATGIKGTSAAVVRNFAGGISITDTSGDDVQLLGTARARIGYTPFSDWLFYGTGGLAWESADRIETNELIVPGSNQLVSTSTPRIHFGWVAGAGIETKLFGSNWIGRIEYLHYDFGSVDATTTVVTTPATPGGTFADVAGRQTIDVVRAGLSYRFGDAAAAGDMPLKAFASASAFAPPAWAGFYIGAHVGYGWKSNDFQDVIAVGPVQTIGGIDSEGWVAGGHFGHNWQYGTWVLGAELDLSATGIKGTSAAVVRNFAGGISITDTIGDDVQLLGTARARIGYTPFSDWLFYGTGGLAWESVDRFDTTIIVVPGSTQFASTRIPRVHFGWVAGAGIETKLFASNWIGRIEYLHYDFGSVDATTSVVTTPAVPGGTFADVEGRQTIDVVRAGLSYRFGDAAAADMPVKAFASASAFAPPVWAGFYIGAHAGYGWKSNDFREVISVVPFQTLGGIDSEGWVAGGHFGHNWQYGAWVVGAEFDLSATGIQGTSAALVRNFAGGITITNTAGDDVQLLGTARARIGYTPFSDWLFYATGGLAWESVDRVDTTNLVVPASTQFASTTTPRVHFGWVAGAGIENKLFGSNWIGRIEYLHYDFGSVDATTTVVTTPATPGGTFADVEGRQTIDVVRAGLSYKF